MIIKRPFLDELALLPSEAYIFDQAPDSRTLDLRIVGRKRLGSVRVTAAKPVANCKTGTYRRR